MATTTAIPKNRISGGSFLLESRTPEEVFTPEDFSEQHQLIGQTTEEFAVNEILPNVEKIEHKEFQVTRDLLKKAGDLGLSGVEIPEAYGGLEMDKVTAAVIDIQRKKLLQAPDARLDAALSQALALLAY